MQACLACLQCPVSATQACRTAQAWQSLVLWLVQILLWETWAPGAHDKESDRTLKSRNGCCSSLVRAWHTWHTTWKFKALPCGHQGEHHCDDPTCNFGALGAKCHEIASWQWCSPPRQLLHCLSP